jgi:hypothetical protein
MFVRDDRIYVFTFKKAGEETECIILDLAGKEQKTIFVPLPENYGGFQYPYDIRDNYFFGLVENEDEETWELHIKNLNIK